LPCVVAMAVCAPEAATDAVALLVLFSAPLGWLQLVPQVVSAEVSAGQILALEQTLTSVSANAIAPPSIALPARFDSLELLNVEYCYTKRTGTRSFAIGPLSCRFDAGTISFVTGGNGSGKSSLIRLLTGLYPTAAGSALLNGQVVDLRSCRDLFSVVLADQPLFDSLYGLEATDPAKVNAMLQRFGVGHVTRYKDRRFTRLDLSTGQRKRVALVAALLEHRPILVLDEWAADQDPATRQTFYREILPALRAEGRTIIAVTHDDRYFDACDRLLVMANGQLVN
jgi:putative pyoverdin transport system ATP-binding/permease protein